VPYRYIYVGLGLLAVAVIAFGVALNTGGEPVEYPPAVEKVYPAPGDLVPVQTTIEVDLETGYRADIYVDGWLVEDAIYVEGTGLHRWTPSPGNPTVNEWTPGDHTVRIVYDTLDGLPDIGEFEWSFRVG
jgi:hypothetical protein